MFNIQCSCSIRLFVYSLSCLVWFVDNRIQPTASCTSTKTQLGWTNSRAIIQIVTRTLGGTFQSGSVPEDRHVPGFLSCVTQRVSGWLGEDPPAWRQPTGEQNCEPQLDSVKFKVVE